MADTLITVKDVPIDYDISQLDDPTELAKFVRVNTEDYFHMDIDDEDIHQYGNIEEMLDDGYTHQQIEELKHTSLSGLLDAEFGGIKLNSIEGLPYFFGQLFDRLLLQLRMLKSADCVIKKVTDLMIGGEVEYIETDAQLKTRVMQEIQAKKNKQKKIDRQKAQAIEELRAAGFELQPDGSMTKIEKRKKKTSKK